MHSIDINEGKTNNYLIPGIGVFLLSLVLFGISSWSPFFLFVGIVLFLLSILLLSASNGLQIDGNSLKYRKYGRSAMFTFGEWKTFQKPTQVVLQLTAQNAFKSSAPMLGRAASLDTKTLTYDIYCIDSTGKEQVIYDFLDYKIAKKALKEISEKFNCEAINRVAEKLEENRRRRH